MRSYQQGRWIPNSRKGEVAKRLQPIKEAEGRKGTCLFVTDGQGRVCGNPVHNNCHVIPESAVLSNLKDRHGKVFKLRWGVSRWEHLFVSSSETNPIDLNDPDAFEPQPVGTGDACVRWFACTDHDNAFGPIDVRHLDFSNPIVRFLCVYRAALYSADLSRLGNRLLKWDKQFLNSGNIRLRAQWIKERKALKTGIPRAKPTAIRLGKIWYDCKTRGKLDPDLVSVQSLTFRSQLRFAACMTYGNGLEVVAFPLGDDWHKMGVLHLSEYADSVKENKEKLTRLSSTSQQSSSCGINMVEELMTNGRGIIAASPESYGELSDEERRAINRTVADASGAGIIPH